MTIRLHYVTTREGLFYGSETWLMKNRIPQKIGNSKNEIMRGVMRINSTGQTREQ